ncbi:MAG: TIGR03013 family XrtA/PEP-CTERM system glycosyltransferase [Spongiibacteraceae bacterium]
MNHIRIFKHHVPVPIAALAVLEYGVLFVSVYVAHWLRFPHEVSLATLFDVSIAPRAHAYAIVNLVCMIAIGSYKIRGAEGLTGSVLRVLVAIFLIGTIILSAAFYLIPTLELYFGRGVLAIAGMVALVGICALRALFRRFAHTPQLRWGLLVVGAGKKAARLEAALAKEEDAVGFNLMGFIPMDGVEPEVSPARLINEKLPLLDLCRKYGAQDLVVAVDERRRSDGAQFPLHELLDCKLNGINVRDDIDFFERELGCLDIRFLSPGWLVFSEGFSFSPFRDGAERLFDVVASSTLLLLSWPFMLAAAIAIKLEEGWSAPLIYSQERVGMGGKIFRVHKFRSMRTDAEKDGKAKWAAKNDSRVTRVGAFIRNTRIDELPQIFNVFKGDMSFVGPRPERPQFVDELTKQIPFYAERHRVKPGITGWAQLCYPYGASAADAEGKLQYDLYYIKNHSLLFDLFILVRTVEVILLGNGVR